LPDNYLHLTDKQNNQSRVFVEIYLSTIGLYWVGGVKSTITEKANNIKTHKPAPVEKNLQKYTKA